MYLRSSSKEAISSEKLTFGPVYSAELASKAEILTPLKIVIETVELGKSDTRAINTGDLPPATSLLCAVVLGEGDAASAFEFHDISKLSTQPVDGDPGSVKVMIGALEHTVPADSKLIITGVEKKSSPDDPNVIVGFGLCDGESTIGSKETDGSESHFSKRFDKADSLDPSQLKVEHAGDNTTVTTLGDTKTELNIPRIETAGEKTARVDAAAKEAGRIAMERLVDPLTEGRHAAKARIKDAAAELEKIRIVQREAQKPILEKKKFDAQMQLSNLKIERANTRSEYNKLGRIGKRREMRELMRAQIKKDVETARANGFIVSAKMEKGRLKDVRRNARKAVNSEAAMKLRTIDSAVATKRAEYQNARNAKRNNSRFRYSGGRAYSTHENRILARSMSIGDTRSLADGTYGSTEEDRKTMIARAEEKLKNRRLAHTKTRAIGSRTKGRADKLSAKGMKLR